MVGRSRGLYTVTADLMPLAVADSRQFAGLIRDILKGEEILTAALPTA
jgi:hypothetical protein